METQNKDRKVELDLLRIVACLSVVMLHAAAQYWYVLPVQGTDWLVCNIYDGISRFGVPVFVMISGQLFLNRPGEVNLKNLYKNHVWRMLVIYVVWSCLYGMLRIWMNGISGGFREYAEIMIAGSYHLWFLPMLVGIYLLLPVLKLWTEHASKRQVEYFLLLFLFLQIGVSTLQIVQLPSLLSPLLDLIKVEMVCSYVGYFILGFYLSKYSFSGKKEKMIYIMGMAGLVFGVLVSAYFSRKQGLADGTAFDSYSLCTFMVSTALFVFFKERVSGKQWSDSAVKLIRELALDSFGVYLMHLGVLNILFYKGIDTMSIPNVIGIPLITIVCFLISILLAAVLRRIPFVGKYIC